MSDFETAENVGKLPTALSTAGAPLGSDPTVGEIAYFTPWNNFVVYYGDQPYYDGTIDIGRIDSGLNPITTAGDSVQLRITRVDQP